jgi:hypothetical protein
MGAFVWGSLFSLESRIVVERFFSYYGHAFALCERLDRDVSDRRKGATMLRVAVPPPRGVGWGDLPCPGQEELASISQEMQEAAAAGDPDLRVAFDERRTMSQRRAAARRWLARDLKGRVDRDVRASLPIPPDGSLADVLVVIAKRAAVRDRTLAHVRREQQRLELALAVGAKNTRARSLRRPVRSVRVRRVGRTVRAGVTRRTRRRSPKSSPGREPDDDPAPLEREGAEGFQLLLNKLAPGGRP